MVKIRIKRITIPLLFISFVRMVRLTKIILFISSFFIAQNLCAQSNLLSAQEIDSILKMKQSLLVLDKKPLYLDFRFPCFLSLLIQNGEIIGRLDYDGESESSFLQGEANPAGTWTMQEIDHEENLIGWLELKGSIPTAIRSIRWYNAERSRSFHLYFAPGEKPWHSTGEDARYFKFRRREPCSQVDLKAYPAGYKMMLSLKSGEQESVLLEPASTEPNGLFQGALLKNKAYRYEKEKTKIILPDGQECRLRKAKELGERHIQNQMSFSELLWVDVPRLDDEVFNLKMKTLINQYLFKNACPTNDRSERQHWWHYRKAEAHVGYLSKDWISLQLRVLNTCSQAPVDTVLFINYFRKEKKFISFRRMTQKMNAEGKTVPNCHECQGTPHGYSIDKDGLIIRHGFELILGPCHCKLYWEEMGFKNLKKWLRTMQ